MKEIPTTSLLPNTPSAQDFSKLRVVDITVLRLANQVVPHTGSCCPLPTAVNYLVRIAPIVYKAFPVGVQSDSGMGCDISYLILTNYCLPTLMPLTLSDF
ncbi:hypothetical protein DSO57_1012801 [Entomophthora muscae]|uniref:Uncharacterized protein n=1 Tax=Entomophthora muscae TaxID=34485 RepID=A0ACC2URU5_9FUNG|nr:hypothetical protein DSO57_1012801 [Entomophthora muscae]